VSLWLAAANPSIGRPIPGTSFCTPSALCPAVRRAVVGNPERYPLGTAHLTTNQHACVNDPLPPDYPNAWTLFAPGT